MNQNIDAMVSGLGNQIDALRSTGNFEGSADLIRKFGEQAKRDTDIELAHSELRFGPPLSVGPPAPTNQIDVTKHTFDVALSFPREYRSTVASIAKRLGETMGPEACFYDENYRAQLARPSLDLLLQDIYRRRTKLIVGFLGTDYQKKDWCGVEFRAIRNIIKQRQPERISGTSKWTIGLSTGYSEMTVSDGRQHTPRDLADMVKIRLTCLVVARISPLRSFELTQRPWAPGAWS